MTAVWIILAFCGGCVVHAALHRRYDDRLARMERRIGWGYGYGAGWVDGVKGLECRNVAPPDGRVRGVESEGRKTA